MKNIKQNIYIGDYEDADNAQKLEEEGIETVISLSTRSPARTENNISYRQFALEDGDGNRQEQVDAAIYHTAGEIESGNKFLIHCDAGVSRSTSVLTAALALVENERFEEMLSYMKDRYSATNPSEGIINQVEKSVERFRLGFPEDND